MNLVVRPTVPPPAAAILAFILITAGTPSLAQSPVPIVTHVGLHAGDRLGMTTAIVGDVDRDGAADYLIGAPYASPAGKTAAGSAYLYSGRTGLLLHRVDGTQAGEQRAWVAALGDVDRDTIPDYAVAAPLLPNGFTQAGSIWVISGRTNEMLYDLRGPADRAKFGTVMTGIGDADGDGGDDIAVGAWPVDIGSAVEVGIVYVIRGTDGALIRSFSGQFQGQRFGYSVAGVGDLDGDGLADVAIGAPALLDQYGRGSVQIVSPKSGQTIGGIISDQAQDAMGFLVAALGDVDGDGNPDWGASAPLRDASGLTNNGAAWVFSGATGAALFQVEGASDDDHWGASLATAGLMNDDVTPDFAVGSPDVHVGGAAVGGAVVYSGVNGAPLLQLGLDPAIPSEGSWLAGGGDVDGDGNDDLMVSASLYSTSSAVQLGRVDVLGYAASRVPAVVDLIPGLCPNVLPSDPDAVLTLLLLGGPGFDVSRVVAESIRLDGVPAAQTPPAPLDVAGPGSASSEVPCGCADANQDGFADLSFLFRRGDLTPVLGAKTDSGYRVRITGRFADGVRLEGAACVTVGSGVAFVAPSPIRRGAEASVFVDVPQGGAPVQVAVFDVRGRRVRTLAHEAMPAGSHRLAWDGKRQDGVPAAGGIYFVRIEVGPLVSTGRIVLVP